MQLARQLHQHGLPLAGVVCRSPESRRTALSVLPEEKVFPLDNLPWNFGHLLLAVQDREIVEAARTLSSAFPKLRVVLHTSGALGPLVLQPFIEAGAAVGVFHPLLAFPHPTTPPVSFKDAYATISGSEAAVEAATLLAHALGMQPVVCPHLDWSRYHAAANLAGPLLFTLFRGAEEAMVAAGFPSQHAAKALESLATRIVASAASSHGWTFLTGPLTRGDHTTVQLHRQALPPELRTLYDALTTYGQAQLQKLPKPPSQD